MSALVTGGAGFIGSHVARRLVEEGRRVRVLHLPGDDLRNLRGLDVELIPGSVLDDACVRRAVRGMDQVYHLAAIYALWTPNPRRMREVNVEGTRRVLDACLRAEVQRVVYTSSIAVFGGQGPGVDATEESPFALGVTGDAYSISKRDSHQVALDFARRGLPVVIVAPCGPLGPGDYGPTPTGRLLLSAVDLPVAVVADTESNVVDVRDVAEGHLLAAQRGEIGRSYLLGHRNLSLRALVGMVGEILGAPRPTLVAPAPLLMASARALTAVADHVTRRAPLLTPAAVRITRLGLRADASRAVEELGLPQTPIEDSVRDALRWFAREGYMRNKRAARRLLASA